MGGIPERRSSSAPHHPAFILFILFILVKKALAPAAAATTIPRLPPRHSKRSARTGSMRAATHAGSSAASEQMRKAHTQIRPMICGSL